MMDMSMLRSLVVILATATTRGQDIDNTVELSVKIENSQAKIVVGIDKSAAAWGSMQHTGFFWGGGVSLSLSYIRGSCI